MSAPLPIETLTVRAHKRQLAWQILVPFFTVTALIIVVAVLVATGVTATRTWADVSTIWLIAPILVFALFFVAVLGFLIYGLARLLQVTPRYTGKAQDFFALLSRWARIIADGATKPFVWFQQAGAMLKSIFNK
jgi:type II secretory pathway component PulL